MTKTTQAHEAFQALLEGEPGKASPQLEQLAKLAAALEPASRPAPDPRFRARLRNEILAQATATEEELFAGLLEGDMHSAPEELKPLVAIASALEPSRLPVPDVAFRYRLRNQLIVESTHKNTAMTRAGAKVAAFNDRLRRSLRVVAATGMAAVMMLGGSAAMAASSNALPGDALYGLKHLKESAELVVVSGEAEGLTLLGFAKTRLGEVKALDQRQETDQRLYVGALDEMDSLTSRGADILIRAFRARKGEDPSKLRQLTTFAMTQRLELTQLIDLLPPAVRPAALDSLNVAEAVEQRAAAVLANPDCPCPDNPLSPGPSGPATSDGSQPVACSCSAGDSAGGSTFGNGDGSGTTNGDGGGNNQTPTDPDDPTGPEDPEDPGDDDVDVPDVDGTDADEQVEDTINDLIDDLGLSPSPLPTLPVPTPTPSVPDLLP